MIIKNFQLKTVAQRWGTSQACQWVAQSLTRMRFADWASASKNWSASILTSALDLPRSLVICKQMNLTMFPLDLESGQAYSGIGIAKVVKVEYLLNWTKKDLDGSGSLSIEEFMSLPELQQNPLVRWDWLNKKYDRHPGGWLTSLTTTATGRLTSRSSSWASLISGSLTLWQQYWFYDQMKSNILVLYPINKVGVQFVGRPEILWR